MTDRNRRNTHASEQQSSDLLRLDLPAVADDRGFRRERRSFSGDREHDELGSEIEDSLAVEDQDDMAMDDGLGGPDRNG